MPHRWSRRQVVQGAGAVGLGLLAGCGRLPWQAQAPRVARVGLLASGAEGPSPLLDAFRQGLQERGYVEGHNLVLESRFAEGSVERLPGLAAELARLSVDVIFAAGSTAAAAAKAATSTVPIVAVGMTSDPVSTGLVTSLARPGGNLTGLFVGLPELGGKLLELLTESAPGANPVAVRRHADDPGHLELFREVETAAQLLRAELRSVNVHGASDLVNIRAALAGAGAEALVVFSGSLLNAQRASIAESTRQSRLPAIALLTGFAEAGGLMNYGPSFPDMYQRAAIHVARVLEGTKPADLPVERPTRFDFVINLRAAQALGLTIPPHVLLQATEVIQ
jgi:putative tryptophan/tyrosine transport system substrate-binding protein